MTTPRIEENDKFNLVHAARYFGKSYDAAQNLYHAIQQADKTILFKTSKGDVHILPNDKLEEIKNQAHQAGLRDAMELLSFEETDCDEHGYCTGIDKRGERIGHKEMQVRGKLLEALQTLLHNKDV